MKPSIKIEIIGDKFFTFSPFTPWHPCHIIRSELLKISLKRIFLLLLQYFFWVSLAKIPLGWNSIIFVKRWCLHINIHILETRKKSFTFIVPWSEKHIIPGNQLLSLLVSLVNKFFGVEKTEIFVENKMRKCLEGVWEWISFLTHFCVYRIIIIFCVCFLPSMADQLSSINIYSNLVEHMTLNAKSQKPTGFEIFSFFFYVRPFFQSLLKALKSAFEMANCNLFEFCLPFSSPFSLFLLLFIVLSFYFLFNKVQFQCRQD